MKKKLVDVAVVSAIMRIAYGMPILVGLAVLGFAGESAATPLPTTLDQLLTPGATTSFSGLGYSTIQAVWGNGAVRTGPPTTGVAVAGALSGSESGLLFTGVGGSLAYADTPLASLAGTTFGASVIYDVTAPAGSLIDDFTISYAGLESGTASVDVKGAVRDPTTLGVLGSFNFNAASDSVHVILTTPESEVQVFTSLTLSSGLPIFGGAAGSAELTSLQETFSTTGQGGPPSVPEPATLSLFAIGVFGLAVRTRHHRARTN